MLQIRNAEAGDYETFVRLFAELGTDDPIPDRERWAAQIQPTMVLAERGERGPIAGYAHYRVLDGTVHLGHLVTDPSSRRSGVGRALIAETADRARSLRATHLTLNVKPTNTPAVALYESAGFRPISRLYAMRMAWTAILAQPAPHLAAVRAIALEEDAAFEARLDLPPGTIALHRRYADRLLRAIGDASFASFDAGFGGASPFVVASVAHGLSLLHAFYPHKQPGHDTILVNSESEAIARELVALGAHLRFETTKMHLEL